MFGRTTLASQCLFKRGIALTISTPEWIQRPSPSRVVVTLVESSTAPYHLPARGRPTPFQRCCSARLFSGEPNGPPRRPRTVPGRSHLKKNKGQRFISRLLDDSVAVSTLRFMDYFGTAVFSMTGTIAAGVVAGMDLLGCGVIGTITAVGGGTVRDLILHRGPVFWVKEPGYLYVSIAASFLTFISYPALVKQGFTADDDLIRWFDSFGIGAFCVIGAQNGLRAGCSPLVAVCCGMVTATFGGVVRDILLQQPPRILHSRAEIYATCALTGASAYVLHRKCFPHAPKGARFALGFFSAVLLRHFAWTYGLRLPVLTDKLEYLRQPSEVVERTIAEMELEEEEAMRPSMAVTVVSRDMGSNTD